MRFWITTLLFFGLAAGTAQAQTPLFESSSKKTALLEVFSSEGCSSCPPADEWTSRLKSDAGLWKNFVPAIFHVDYWDNLGWKDRFASAEYTQRQSRYVESWGESTVYTPGFVLNGKPWNRWHQSRTVPPSEGSPGVLKAEDEGARGYRITFSPAEGGNHNYEAHAAVLGFDVSSNVRNGENAGRLLKHDFIVLDFKTAPMKDHPPAAFFQFENKNAGQAKKGLAVWVTRENDLSPVQAGGGYLPS